MTTQSPMTCRWPHDAFEDAIKAGVLSEDQRAANFAGHFMYMFTQDGRDGFKHRNTRAYVYSTVPA